MPRETFQRGARARVTIRKIDVEAPLTRAEKPNAIGGSERGRELEDRFPERRFPARHQRLLVDDHNHVATACGPRDVGRKWLRQPRPGRRLAAIADEFE